MSLKQKEKSRDPEYWNVIKLEGIAPTYVVTFQLKRNENYLIHLFVEDDVISMRMDGGKDIKLTHLEEDEKVFLMEQAVMADKNK